MATDYKAMITELNQGAGNLKQAIPDTMSAFGALGKASYGDGALSKKYKELIALAIAVAGRCEGCIAYHAKGAFSAGASREEVAEMLGIAVQMGGGPSMIYSTKALQAYDQFAA